jgi:hypothetical protein
MAPADWIGIASGLALAAVALAVALPGLRGGRLRHEPTCRLECPLIGIAVDCRVDQDMRTGQWGRVHACSAFSGMGEVVCRQDCARLMNLGLLQPQTQHA